MRNIVLALLFIKFCSLGYSQNSGFATSVLIDNDGIKDKISRILNEENMTNLYSVVSENLLYYDWDSKTHEIKFSEKNKFKEKPSEIVIFLKSYGYFDYEPPLIIKQDTSGKTTNVFFELTHEFKYYSKHVDAVTSTVISNNIHALLPYGKSQLHIKDYEKVFGGDPKVIQRTNNKKYNEIIKKLKAEYAPKIEEKYIADYKFNNRWTKLSKYVLGKSQKSFEVIKPTNSSEKKIKSFKFKGGINDNLIKGDNYQLLVKIDIDGFHYYDKACNVFIDEIGEVESTAKTDLFGCKELTNLLKSNQEILLVKNDNILEINRINSKKDLQKLNIAIKKECMFCNQILENSLYECPVFTLIERNAPELTYFAKLTKDERFIDYSLDNLQGRKLGYQLLITESNDNFEIIETETNRVISSFPTVSVASNDNKKSEKDIKLSNIQRFLNAYDAETYKVEWINILKEKKEKIIEILIYHPAGMDRFMVYDLNTLVEENVDGETFQRKNKIGTGKIGKSYSPNISVLKLRDGEDTVFQAKKKGEKIIIEVSDKKYN